MTTVEDIYKGNKATDFQPETQNPQNNVGGGLQPGSQNLQPVTNQTPGTQQFPSVARLKVLGVENPTTAATSKPVQTSDTSLPLAFTIGIFLVFVIAVVLLLLARPANNKKTAPIIKDETPESKPVQKTVKKKKSRKKRKAKK